MGGRGKSFTSLNELIQCICICTRRSQSGSDESDCCTGLEYDGTPKHVVNLISAMCALSLVLGAVQKAAEERVGRERLGLPPRGDAERRMGVVGRETKQWRRLYSMLHGLKNVPLININAMVKSFYLINRFELPNKVGHVLRNN